MNRFGIIPAILNHEKKLDCKKYIIKNAINRYMIANILFNLIFLSFLVFYFYFSTNTLLILEKSTAVFICAYLSVMF